MTAPAYIEAHSPRVGLSRVGGDCVSRPVQGARGRAFQICPVIIGKVSHERLTTYGLLAKVLTSTRTTRRGFGLGAFPVTGPASFVSLTDGRRNRMDGCALRQTRAGQPVHIFRGQSILTIGAGRGGASLRLPISFQTGWFPNLRQPGRVSAVLSLCAPRHNSKARQHGAAEMAALQQLKLIEARNEFSDGQSHGGRGGMDRARTDGGVND